MKKVVIYPLSADPITSGHVEIVERTLKLFPDRKLHVVIANNRDKKHLFTAEQRKKIVEASLAHLGEKVKIVVTEGIITEYAIANNVDVMIRGIRNSTDFDYEINLEQFTRNTSKMETVYLSPYTAHLNTSSSLIRMFIQSDHIAEAKNYMQKDGYYKMIKIFEENKNQ